MLRSLPRGVPSECFEMVEGGQLVPTEKATEKDKKLIKEWNDSTDEWFKKKDEFMFRVIEE